MNPFEARLVDLELRFMKLQRYAEELSDVVSEQRRQIEALIVEARRLRDGSSAEGPAAGNDRPPHY